MTTTQQKLSVIHGELDYTEMQGIVADIEAFNAKINDQIEQAYLERPGAQPI